MAGILEVANRRANGLKYGIGCTCIAYLGHLSHRTVQGHFGFIPQNLGLNGISRTYMGHLDLVVLKVVWGSFGARPQNDS